MKKKRLILLVLCVIVLLGVLTAVIISVSEPPEPMYEGKPLSAILRPYVSSFDTRIIDSRMRKAVESLGTNALPTLLRWLSAKDSPIKLKAVGLFQKLPWVNYRYWTAEDRHLTAAFGFEILGPKARLAVPELVEILNSRLYVDSLFCTIRSLASIGPDAGEAVPALLDLITSTNETVQLCCISALGRIPSRPDLEVPVLIKLLTNTDLWIRTAAADSLGAFGTNARQAIGPLSRMIKVGSFQEQDAASNTLKLIAPEVLEKVVDDHGNKSP